MAESGTERVKKRLLLEGVAASPGFGAGEVLVLNLRDVRVEERSIPAEGVEAEVERFRQAIEATRREIQAVQARFARDRGQAHSRILEPQLLILRDTMAIENTIDAIRSERKSADFVFNRILTGVEASLGATADEYLRERVADLRDVRRRVLRALRGAKRISLADLAQPAVVVARDLYPIDMAQMRPQKVLAIVTERGGRTSHSAILARQLEIPAVVGVKELPAEIVNGQGIVVDGTHGRVILNPDEADLEKHRQELERYVSFTRQIRQHADRPAQTMDGRAIRLVANVNGPADVEAALRLGAEGVGLFRTEYLFMNRNAPPDEETQYQAYREVVEGMKPHPVVIRTLDLGEDKAREVSWGPDDLGFVVGWRGIRFSLAYSDLFRTQLRAIFRAARHGDVRILFPMVSGLPEFREAAEITRTIARESAGAKGEPPPNTPIGVMIETPAAALMARELAREADFFSLGTNDLIQYTLAVDRVDERMAHLFEPLHPAVLRLIRQVVEAGREAGIPVVVCGEMSRDPLSALVLVGLGVSELSVNGASIPELKRIIRSLQYEEARRFADRCVQMATAEEVTTDAKAVLDARFWRRIGLS